VKKILVIQGAGLDERGKSQIEIFGPETLEEINAAISSLSSELDLEIDIVQSNNEAKVAKMIDRIDDSFDAILINPGGFTSSKGVLTDAIANSSTPTYEIHASNPTQRGVTSTLLPHCKGGVCGFGYDGYRIALSAISVQS